MKKLIILICCLGLFISCEDFLDRNPYTSLNEDLAIVDTTTANYAVAGIYHQMQSESSFGRMVLVIPDAATSNLMLSASNSNRYIATAQWTTNASSGEPYQVWLPMYTFINSANKIIGRIDNIPTDSDPVKIEKRAGQIKAEALTMRALGHFTLVSLFAQAYPGGETSLGVPYMEQSHVFEKPARDDVKTVYTKLIADLTEAISLFTTNGNPRDNAPYRADIWFAKALLAKIYMHQLDYAKAKPVLKDIIDNSGYSLLSNDSYADAWKKTYNSADKTEFIFAIANRADDYPATGSLGYIYIQGGYADLRPSQELMDLYSTTDVRATAFFARGNTSSTSSEFFVSKYPSRDGANGLCDNPVMRLSDVYLLYAEACAYTSDETTAVTYIDLIRKRADITTTMSTETGNDLKTKIFIERRKELAFEGQYLYDLKRYHMSIPSGYRANGSLYTTISYPSAKRAYLIPQAEMDANPNMVQNPLE